MIKKNKFTQILSVFMLFLMIFTILNPINVLAATPVTNDWIAEYLADYKPLQTLLEEYPDTELVQQNTTYILNENIEDKEGNVIKSDQKAFSSISELENYENSAKRLDLLTSKITTIGVGENLITPNTVSNGTPFYKTYSKIKMGLSLYRYSSTSFMVACTYDWIDGFDYDLLYNYKAVIGLALGSGLSMLGNSYDGRITMTVIGGSVVEKTPEVRATGTSGIGYSIKVNAQTYGMLKDMQGVISCTAKKVANSIVNCPAYGEYAAVTSTLSLYNFSVSIPAGISFGSATVSTPYSIQDNLDLR